MEKRSTRGEDEVHHPERARGLTHMGEGDEDISHEKGYKGPPYFLRIYFECSAIIFTLHLI